MPVPVADRCVEEGCEAIGYGPGQRCTPHLMAYQRSAKARNDAERLRIYLANQEKRRSAPGKCPAHPSEDVNTCEGCEAIAEDRIQRGEV